MYYELENPIFVKQQFVVYFDQQMGAAHAVFWSKSSFSAF